MKTRSIVALLVVIGVGFAAYETGAIGKLTAQADKSKTEPAAQSHVPSVTVARVQPEDFIETVLVTGSLVPREEILVAPEVDGLRVVELKAEEGDRVKKGDVLATLVSDQLDAQVAQNAATLARSEAAIAQAGSSITESEARVAEADAALERAKPLAKSKYLSESVLDQRTAAARTARAQLQSSKDGHRVAEADKAQAEAQRKELLWRQGNTLVRAPEDGLVSKRGARIGSIALGATIAGSGEPMFRIIARGEIELDAEASEAELPKIKAGQAARVSAAGIEEVEGKVRLVSPEVDKATRLGRVRIFLGANPALRIGSFARGTIATAKERGLAIPQSAILYGRNGATVQVAVNGKIETRNVTLGLAAAGLVEAKAGLADGDLVVAKAGTFLRNGDQVKPIFPDDAISEVR